MATTTNVSASTPAIAGAISIAPVGTTLPTDATTALDEAFKTLGYISEDGLTNSNSPSGDTVKAWGGDPVLMFNGDKEDTFGWSMLETLNVDVLKMVYGEANVTGTLATGITVTANNKDVPAKAFVVDMIMREGALKRIVIPSGLLTELGDITYTDTDAVAYEVTITAQKDANGNTHYEYIKSASVTNG